MVLVISLIFLKPTWDLGLYNILQSPHSVSCTVEKEVGLGFFPTEVIL